jgi:dTDP-4-dehydrorhamnose reductase
MKILLLGSTGMLGQALYNKLKNKDLNVITVSRSGSDYNIDLATQLEKVKEIIELEQPNVVINTVALINLQECEKYPERAYLINARVPGVIADFCEKTGVFFVQISTDHYYIMEGKSAHCENENVCLVNEYARTKYAGEILALTYSNTLVIRTNIVGFRNQKNNLTFVEWIIQSLENEQLITGFEDFFTSSIDVYHFSDILIELINQGVTGIINVASLDILSKYEFIYKLAILLNKEEYVRKGKMEQFMGVRRANSLGLDVTRLKSVLIEQSIPSSNSVIQTLVGKYREGVFNEL